MSAKTPKPPTGCAIKSGRYYRVLYAGLVDGKQRLRWIPLTRVSEGLPALYAALSELSRRPASDTRMKPRIEAWLIHALPGLSATEQKEKARKAGVMSEAFAEFETHDVQARHILAFLSQWTKAGKLRMAQSYRAALKQFFDWVVIQGDRPDNPVDPVRTQAPPPNMRYMTDEAFTLIRTKLLGNDDHKAASGEMMQIYVDLAYLTGHGGVDVRTLRWAQVDETAGLIRIARAKVAKTTAAKVDIVITPAIAAVLDRAKSLMKAKSRVSPYVVHNLEGSAYSAHGVGTAWERARNRAVEENPNWHELKSFTLKDLRAKFATDAKRAGYTDEQIAAGMAHIETSTTTIYLKQRMAKQSSIELEIPK